MSLVSAKGARSASGKEHTGCFCVGPQFSECREPESQEAVSHIPGAFSKWGHSPAAKLIEQPTSSLAPVHRRTGSKEPETKGKQTGCNELGTFGRSVWVWIQARAAGSCDSKEKAYLPSGQRGLYPSWNVPGLSQVISRTPGPLFMLMAQESCEENRPALHRGKI